MFIYFGQGRDVGNSGHRSRTEQVAGHKVELGIGALGVLGNAGVEEGERLQTTGGHGPGFAGQEGNEGLDGGPVPQLIGGRGAVVSGGPAHGHVQVVLQVFTDGGELNLGSDPGLLEDLWVADSGNLEDPGAVDGASRQDHLLLARNKDIGRILELGLVLAKADLDADGLVSFENDLGDVSVKRDGQVGPVEGASVADPGGVGVGTNTVAADKGLAVAGAELAFTVVVVGVGDFGVAGGLASFDPVGGVRVRVAFVLLEDALDAAHAVIALIDLFAGEALPVFGFLEVLEHGLEVPSFGAVVLGPVVVVVLATNIGTGVGGRATTGNATTREVHHTGVLVLRDLAFKHPVQVRVTLELEELPDGLDIDDLVVAGTGLEEENLGVGVLGETRGDDGAGRAGADHDDWLSNIRERKTRDHCIARDGKTQSPRWNADCIS